MNIIVCIKQVPNTDTVIKVKPDGSGIDQAGIEWVMNPYDEFGVEEALRLKEKFGGEVTIVSLGPAKSRRMCLPFRRRARSKFAAPTPPGC